MESKFRYSSLERSPERSLHRRLDPPSPSKEKPTVHVQIAMSAAKSHPLLCVAQRGLVEVVAAALLCLLARAADVLLHRVLLCRVWRNAVDAAPACGGEGGGEEEEVGEGGRGKKREGKRGGNAEREEEGKEEECEKEKKRKKAKEKKKKKNSRRRRRATARARSNEYGLTGSARGRVEPSSSSPSSSSSCSPSSCSSSWRDWREDERMIGGMYGVERLTRRRRSAI